MKPLAHSYSSIKMFENCPLRYYEQRIAKSVKDEGHEANIHGDRVHKALEAKLKQEGELPEDMAPYKPLVDTVARAVGNGLLEIEKEMTITRNMVACGWWDEGAWLRSKLDVFITKGADAFIFDWKTGKRRVDPFQLKLFAAQVFLNYPEIKTVKTALIWLKTSEIDSETYQRDEAKLLWQEVLTRIHRIERAQKYNNWPAKPSGLCPYCPLFKTCTYARR